MHIFYSLKRLEMTRLQDIMAATEFGRDTIRRWLITLEAPLPGGYGMTLQNSRRIGYHVENTGIICDKAIRAILSETPMPDRNPVGKNDPVSAAALSTLFKNDDDTYQDKGLLLVACLMYLDKPTVFNMQEATGFGRLTVRRWLKILQSPVPDGFGMIITHPNRLGGYCIESMGVLNEARFRAHYGKRIRALR